MTVCVEVECGCVCVCMCVCVCVCALHGALLIIDLQAIMRLIKDHAPPTFKMPPHWPLVIDGEKAVINVALVVAELRRTTFLFSEMVETFKNNTSLGAEFSTSTSDIRRKLKEVSPHVARLLDTARKFLVRSRKMRVVPLPQSMQTVSVTPWYSTEFGWNA